MDQISTLSQAVCQLKDTIYCPICFDVLSDPVSTKCNHHFCSCCFKKLFNGRGSKHCPVCHTSLTRRSCASNNGSLNQVVHAVNYLIECLGADTGIDFSKETTVPHSSREATCEDEIVEKPIILNRENQTFKRLEKPHQELPSKNKNVRQYQRKELSSNIDDSFVFPADFIHPSKGTNTKITDSAQSVNTKVSSWLTENENDLKKCDDMSILNGSLPKKVPVDLNSSSEEELLSVSQVPTNNTHLAPLKYKTGLEIISEQPEEAAKVKAKSPEFKDPYEFISSQKSNQAQTLKKPMKRRNTRSCGSKKKPLGLDISRLVNEPYVKKKKTEMNDTMFEVPVRLDDTFDQLLVGNKRSQFVSVGNKGTESKSLDKTEKNVFPSQSDPADESIVLSDFSAGSDDDWAPSKPKKFQKNKRLSNEKAFKPRLSKAKTSRKSAIKKKEEEYEKEMENLSKTFEEVENYKLVTSSQVLREEMARKQSTCVGEESNDIICEATELKKSSVHEHETKVIPLVDESNSKEAEHSLSPGWSRVNSFRKETNHDKITSGKSGLTSTKTIKPAVHKNASILFKKPKVVLEDISESRENVCVSNTQLKELVGISEDQIQNIGQVKECLAKHMQSPSASGVKMNVESPETPVRYFNLSQAEERARIMGDVVKSLECSIEEEEEEKVLQDVSSGESKIKVSMPTLPDEDDRLVENCINNTSICHERNVESWKQFNDLNTPASVSLTCSKASENSVNEDAKESQVCVEKVGDSYEGIRTSQKRKSSLPLICSGNTRNVEEQVCKENILSTTSNDVQSDKKNTSGNPSRGILVVKTIEESKIQNSTKANVRNEHKRRSPDHVERRVHFAEEPVEANKLCSPSGLNVLFFKAGSCLFSYCRPRVRFLFLGSCVSKAERGCEVDKWIIKVSKTPPVCFCGSTSAKSLSVESEKCSQHGLSLECAENEEKRINTESRIKDEINCKSPDSVRKLQVGSSAYEDIQIHSESNVNSATCSVRKLQPHLENKDILKEKTNNKPGESVQTPASMMAVDTQISSEKPNKSDVVEKIQNLSVVQNSSFPDKLDLATFKQRSGGTVKTNVNNCTPPLQSLRASGEDVFTSCQNSDMQESLPQKVLRKVSHDVLETEEHNGIVPYQEPQRKVSDDVATNSDNCKSELSWHKGSEKQSEDDVFITAQSRVEVNQKASFTKNIIKSDDAQQPHNGMCSTNEDIFQSNEMNIVPPFQEINSLMGTKESREEKMIYDVSTGFTAQKKRASFESDGRQLSNKFNLKIITNNQLSPNCSNICINSEDVFKTEGNSVIEASTERSDSKISNNFISENLKSNSNHAHDIIVEPDLKASVDQSSAIDKTPEHSYKQRKRVRALIDSSDDSDSDEKVVKKASVVSELVNPVEINLASPLSPQNAYENTHSKMDTQSIQNSDEDYLLNSEELLQRVIDNINEDLGHSRKPQLRGAKKRILSDSEDEMLDCEVKDRKLSKSPEYDQEVIDLNSDHSSDDEDVFTDKEDNDADIVECTPRKRRAEEESKARESSEKLNVYRTTPDDVFENVPQDSTPKKFVLPHSSNLDSKHKIEIGKMCHEELKETDHLKEKGMSDSISMLKTKESTEQMNTCNSPRKAHLDTIGKSPLRMRLGSSQSNQKNIQKNIIENTDKPLSTVSKDLKAQPRMVFVCSGLTTQMLVVVKKFAREIGAGFSDNFTLSMTHLIVNVDENQATPKTLKYLQAVAAKKWVVSFNWITACISSKKLLPEESFEAIDSVGLDGPRRSRLSSESLFKNVQACFIEPFQNITVDKLQEIFMMCGGMVVDSPEGFSIVSKDVLRIIIVDTDTEVNAALCQKWITLNRAVTLNYDWLVDCIGTHTILPLPSSFAVPFTREQVLACGIPEYLLDEDDLEATEMSDISGLPEP